MNRASDARRDSLTAWLRGDLGRSPLRVELASADASFRRYFRVFTAHGSLIVMDAPPEKENLEPYLRIANLLQSTGVHVPQIHAVDAARGFVLMEDLGSIQYLSRLTAGDDPEPLYADALRSLADIQVNGAAAALRLSAYDAAALRREMQLMPEWFCTRHLQLALAPDEHTLLGGVFDFLIHAAERQPQVFVHRDYHSRNLMVTEERNPGVIDFQDAVRGPIGYDLVSLLKDCYIRWPRERVESWLRDYRLRIAARGLNAGANELEFIRWFDLIGVQRHVKVLGIFARLWHRDGKQGYLADLPLTLDYLRDASARYGELQEFANWLERRVVPLLAVANARELARR